MSIDLHNNSTVLRVGGSPDIPFIRTLLPLVFDWHTEVASDIPSWRYLEGWGRPGDYAVIALEKGHRVGAGWFRLFGKSAPTHGVSNSRIPELIIATADSRFATRITQLLLADLMREARDEGHLGLSVLLRHDHPAIALYEQAGFRPVAHAEVGITSVLMFDSYDGRHSQREQELV